MNKSEVFQVSIGGFKDKQSVTDFLLSNNIDDNIKLVIYRNDKEPVYPNFSISNKRKVNSIIIDIRDLGFKHRARIEDIVVAVPRDTGDLKIAPIDQTSAFHFFVEHWDRPKGEIIRLLPFLNSGEKSYCLVLEDCNHGQKISIEEILSKRFFYKEDKFLVMVEDFKL